MSEIFLRQTQSAGVYSFDTRCSPTQAWYHRFQSKLNQAGFTSVAAGTWWACVCNKASSLQQQVLLLSHDQQHVALTANQTPAVFGVVPREQPYQVNGARIAINCPTAYSEQLQYMWAVCSAGVPDTATDPPPYTLLSTPVYSLVTRSEDGLKANMNIVTYASPIAIQPQRKYALGLYIGTLSWENMHQTHKGVLQVMHIHMGLSEHHKGYYVQAIDATWHWLTAWCGLCVEQHCIPVPYWWWVLQAL